MDDLDRLERLVRLRDSGGLTEEEFQSQKAALLAPPAGVGRFGGRLKLAAGAAGLVIILVTAAIFIGRPSDAQNETQMERANSAMPVLANSAQNESPANALFPVAENSGPSAFAWATSGEVLGANPSYLEQRLGVARERTRDHMRFDVGGCRLDYVVAGNEVTSVSISMTQSCRVNIEGRTVTSRTTLASLQDLGGAYTASCLYMCGNAADPTIDLVRPGFRANGFVAVRFTSVDAPIDSWERSIRRQHGMSENESPENYELFMNASNPPPEVVREIGRGHVEVIEIKREF